MREEMVWAYRQGFSLIPLRPDSKKPAVDWGTYIHRIPTAEEYRSWAEKGLFKTGYGIVTGKVSGITVLDVDIRSGGLESLQEHDVSILDEYTWLVDTPNGRHLYYKYSPRAKQGQAIFGEGVDIRNDGGFVVGPGSRVGDKEYTWAMEHSPQEVQLSDPPEWLLQGPGRRVDKELVRFNEPIREGGRNKKLASLCGTLLAKEFPLGVVRGVMEYVNENYVEPPVDRKELETIMSHVKKTADERRVYSGA